MDRLRPIPASSRIFQSQAMRLVLRGLLIWVFVLGAKAVLAEGAPSMLDAGPLKILYETTPAEKEFCDAILSTVSWRADGGRQYFSIETDSVALKEAFLREGTAGESLFVYNVDIFGDGSFTSVFLFERLTSNIFYQSFYAVHERVKNFLSEEMKLSVGIAPSLEENFVTVANDIKSSTSFSDSFIKFDPSGQNNNYYKTVNVHLVKKFNKLYIIKINDTEIGDPILSVNLVGKDGTLRPICAFDSKYGARNMYLSGKSTKYRCPDYQVNGGNVDFPTLGAAQGTDTNIKINSDSNWLIYEIKNSESFLVNKKNWGLIQSQDLYFTISKDLFFRIKKEEKLGKIETSILNINFDFDKNAVEASEVRESNERIYLIFYDLGPRLTGGQPEEGVTVYTVNRDEIDHVCSFSFAITPPPGVTIRP